MSTQVLFVLTWIIKILLWKIEIDSTYTHELVGYNFTNFDLFNSNVECETQKKIKLNWTCILGNYRFLLDFEYIGF